MQQRHVSDSLQFPFWGNHMEIKQPIWSICVRQIDEIKGIETEKEEDRERVGLRGEEERGG